ncbi:hypothetical protein [Vulcanococcus sp.]|jgi:hypothetical protein|uniref:hypothetical protein n=1 Tax=Vulcanococcus sp. TaxID=2856995 RepID=UPI0037D9FDE4
MPVSFPAQQGASSELRAPLLKAMAALADLVAELARQLERTTAPVLPTPPAAAATRPWEERSVEELRAELRSYPIDRTSLPAPIELLRRSELIEALEQIRALEA